MEEMDLKGFCFGLRLVVVQKMLEGGNQKRNLTPLRVNLSPTLFQLSYSLIKYK
jgi:hypothetical protein